MSKIETGYEWNANLEGDALRLVESDLPEDFWRHCAYMNGEGMPPTKSKFTLDSDAITMGRSYASVARDKCKSITVPSRTLTRALAIRRERLTMIENAALEEREASRIQWGD